MSASLTRACAFGDVRNLSACSWFLFPLCPLIQAQSTEEAESKAYEFLAAETTSLCLFGRDVPRTMDAIHLLSSLRGGHANLLWIGPILSDDPRRESCQQSTSSISWLFLLDVSECCSGEHVGLHDFSGFELFGRDARNGKGRWLHRACRHRHQMLWT